MQRINRITPTLGAENYKTYAIVRPRSTHMREVSCAEAECMAYQHGWRTLVDERTEQGNAQAHYIRRQSGRHFTEERDPNGGTVFTFSPGQRCFNGPHEVPVEREPLYVVRDGDWRGNPRRTPERRHVRGEDWVEDFALHQMKVADDRQRG